MREFNIREYASESHFISNYLQKFISLMSHSTECFCGNVIPEESVKLSDPQCNYKCSGDAKQLCGGYFTISIFETGIKSNSVAGFLY